MKAEWLPPPEWLRAMSGELGCRLGSQRRHQEAREGEMLSWHHHCQALTSFRMASSRLSALTPGPGPLRFS